MKKLLSFVFLAAFVGTTAHAADKAKLDERIEAAHEVLHELLATPDRGIPDGVASHATCVAVIPGFKKGAFLVGAEYGQGVVIERIIARSPGADGLGQPVEGFAGGDAIGVATALEDEGELSEKDRPLCTGAGNWKLVLSGSTFLAEAATTGPDVFSLGILGLRVVDSSLLARMVAAIFRDV